MRLVPIVIVTGLGALNLACSGIMSTTSESCRELKKGTSCWPDEKTCWIPGQESDCGLNGYECKEGKWDDIMTFCNPPPLPPGP